MSLFIRVGSILRDSPNTLKPAPSQRGRQPRPAVHPPSATCLSHASHAGTRGVGETGALDAACAGR